MSDKNYTSLPERIEDDLEHDFMFDVYHDGFEDGIKFFLRHLYLAPVSCIVAEEWAERLALFRRWKSVKEWDDLIKGEI